MLHVFISGVMQGNRNDRLIEAQDYRLRIAEALRAHIPDVKITDPWMLHPDSVNYGPAEAAQTFLTNTRLAGEADVLIAYLPQASMGTAMEMWQAYQHNAAIIAVSPLSHNWAIRVTSQVLLPDLDSLLTYIADGQVQQLAANRVNGSAD